MLQHDSDFGPNDKFVWYYEGRNGWWQYDERSLQEIEEKHVSGLDSSEVLIAGHLYVIDFRNMRQHRVNQPRRFRRIKRDLMTIEKKGIAGLRKLTASKPDESLEIVTHISTSKNGVSTASCQDNSAVGSTLASVDTSCEVFDVDSLTNDLQNVALSEHEDRK